MDYSSLEIDFEEEAFRTMSTADLLAMGLIDESIMDELFDQQLTLIADPTPEDFAA